MKRRRRGAVGAALTTILFATACTESSNIRPAEIPKLVVDDRAHQGGQPLPVLTSWTLVTPEGTTVEVKGEFDLTITMTDGTEFDFTHPVVAHRLASRVSVLEVIGGNRRATVIDLAKVREAEVTWPNVEGSVILGSVLGVATGTLVAIAIVAK